MKEIQLTLTAKIEEWSVLRHHIEQISANHGWASDDLYTLTLICEEWFMNIVHHAYQHSTLDKNKVVEFQLKLVEKQQVELYFEDEGIPFNPFNIVMPEHVTANVAQKIGGLGIYFIMKKLTSYRYQYIAPRNCVHMVYTLKQAKGE